MIRSMNRVLVAVLILFAAAGQASADITYTIENYPADQNGATLSGVITTDGATGNLASSDILSWTWTITPAGGSPTTFSSSDPGSHVFIQGSVLASPSQITLAQPSTDADEFDLVNSGIVANGILDYFRSAGEERYQGGTPAGNIWVTSNPAMGGHDPWIIATASASAVPEPSSLTLLGIAAGCLALTAQGWLRALRQERKSQIHTEWMDHWGNRSGPQPRRPVPQWAG